VLIVGWDCKNFRILQGAINIIQLGAKPVYEYPITLRVESIERNFGKASLNFGTRRMPKPHHDPREILIHVQDPWASAI
jgi:hypothetical protein